ncbi:MAG: GTP-binding protein, partial [Bacteroidota bacterium]
WQYIQHKFPGNIIRSKGLFWIASRPGQALVWGQAGGSLRTDSAGVWWSSMPYQERTRYASFVDNKDLIEAKWDVTFGDRKTEIVFIGQDMEEAQIRADLNECLSTEEELATAKWKDGYEDNWPIHRAYALQD